MYYNENDQPIALTLDERAAREFLDVYAMDSYDNGAPRRLAEWCEAHPDPVPTSPRTNDDVCIEGGWYRQDEVDAVIWPAADEE